MKQKICTSIEQSKELLELGLSPETADMHWFISNTDISLRVGYSAEINSYYDKNNTFDYIPAWSLSALLDLMPNYVINKVDNKTYANLYYDCKSSYNNLVDAAFEMVKRLIENDYIKTGKK